MTAAFYLVRLGHDVTLYDAFPEPGGILRYGIPQYRLPKEILLKEIELVEMLGVRFVMNRRLGEDLTLFDLKQAFDAVYLAKGAWKEIPLRIPGDCMRALIS